MPKPALTYDEIDHRLLDELQRDASRSLRTLGALVGQSASAVQRRLARYRAARVIQRTVAVLDPRRSADVVLAIVLVTLDRESTAHHGAFQRRLTDSPDVQQIYTVSGDWDYVVVLATTSMSRHGAVSDRLFKDAPNVKRYTTMFALEAVRVGCYLPTR